MKRVKDLKVGDNFQMEGLNTNGEKVLADASTQYLFHHQKPVIFQWLSAR